MVADALSAAPMTVEHFARLRKGGVTAVNYTFAGSTADLDQALKALVALHQNVDAHRDLVTIARTTDDIKAARSQGRIALIAGLQNARPVSDSLQSLYLLYLLGVRVIQLTYNERNFVGDGCTEASNAGVSGFGRKLIAEMNRLGIVIDLGHCGERTTLEAIDISKDPVIVSHAMAKDLCPSPRNKNRVVFEAIAARNGVIGVSNFSPFTYSNPNRRPGLKEWFAHLDYFVEHAGIDHVCIGTDIGEGESKAEYDAVFSKRTSHYPEVTDPLGKWYTYETRLIEGFDSVTHFPRVTQGLLDKGYSDVDIRKILGGNLMRVLGSVIDKREASRVTQ
jgi:membrane dipeptidase